MASIVKLALLAAAVVLPVCVSQAWAQTTTAPDASGPQTAVPAPLNNGRADTPGGSAQNGVIRPPTTHSTPVIRPSSNSAMPVIRPPASGAGSRMPVIKPPGTAGSAPVVPK